MCPRPKGSKNKPKVSPLVEEKKIICADDAYAAMVSEGLATPEEVEGIKKKVNEIVGPSKMEIIAPVIEDLMLVKEKLEQLKKKPTVVKANKEGIFSGGFNAAETTFPEGWEKLGKIEKLQWLTANRK